MKHAHRFLLAGALLAGGLLAAAAAAHADEITVVDLSSGKESTIHCWGVTSETWSEVKYREREHSAEKSVPTLTVVSIRRADKSTSAQSLRKARADLESGNYKEAADALKDLSGGGPKIDFDTSRRVGFTPFGQGDPRGRGRRPSWISEYAHFFYAKASYLLGTSQGNRQAVEDALLAVDDRPIPGGDGKQTTGGFLGRFAGGNSRFYPEALWIKAHALVELKQYDDAARTFTQLYQAAQQVPLAPRWAYEGMIGPGVINEAKGDLNAARIGYGGAVPTMEVLMERETRPWMMRQYGHYRARAHMRVAAVMLEDAEKSDSPAKYSALRLYIEKGSPKEIRSYAEGKGWPKERVDALVAGARDPDVQAVSLNGLGLAYLHEARPRTEEAMLAFKAVTVEYFQVPEQHARALYYLELAAAQAAQAPGVKPEVKTMYQNMAAEADKMLHAQHPKSDWAAKPKPAVGGSR
jgi:tetratricopeptide (TPR) repeat protein